LLCVGVPVLLVLLVWLWRFLRRPTVRKTALQALDAIANDAAASDLEKVQRLAVLVRRVSISVYAREDAAGLTGAGWLAFLDGPMASKPFSEGPGRLLIDAPYRRELQGDVEALFALCREWIKRLPKPGKATRPVAQTQPDVPPLPVVESSAPKDPNRFARPVGKGEGAA
jgi:hypothetical protein